MILRPYLGFAKVPIAHVAGLSLCLQGHQAAFLPFLGLRRAKALKRIECAFPNVFRFRVGFAIY